MSISGKRIRVVAEGIAQEFKNKIMAGTFERWEIAGAIRRKCTYIGDADHLMIPKVVQVSGNDLFGTLVAANAAWAKLDDLVADPASGVIKAMTDAGRPCWGDSHRMVMFRGMKQDIYTTDASRWGTMLAVRTGPADLSQYYMVRSKEVGVTFKDGFHAYERDKARPTSILSESDLFTLLAMPDIPPDERDRFAVKMQARMKADFKSRKADQS